jgi:hypothetical protein
MGDRHRGRSMRKPERAPFVVDRAPVIGDDLALAEDSIGSRSANFTDSLVLVRGEDAIG